MSFGTPWMLALLPLVGLVGWLMARARRLERDAACRLKGARSENEQPVFRKGDWRALAVLVCIIVALARPQWNPRSYDVERRGRDVVFVVDVSRSMLAADVFPSRLEMARIAIHEALPAISGQRVALVTFAGEASVRVPLTLDHGFVRYMLDRADPSDMDRGSTSLQAAMEKVADTVLADANGRQRDLVIFTDGEDHLSDFDKTAESLARCDARVLIVGLGDPIRGARVPDPQDEDQWMRHNDLEVVSKLEESTLTELADEVPNVTYFPARTRPFDLVPVYQQLTEGAGDWVVEGGLRQVRYTEGYPYLLALAVVLSLPLSSLKRPTMHSLILIGAVLIPGCAREVEDDGDQAAQTMFTQGTELLTLAQEQGGIDALAERSLLVDAREQYLRAALLRPGHIETARQITTITRRLGELAAVIEQQRAEEERQRETLAETVERLQKLCVRQELLSQQSQDVLSRRPVPTGADVNNPDYMANTEQFLPQEELNELAPPVRTEQQAVRKDTASVLDGITLQQNTLRQLLTRAYGDIGRQPATELDEAVDLLTTTVAAQDEALANLAPEAVRWPRANTALHTAAGQMQHALDTLSSLLPPKTDEKDDSMAPRGVGDYDEDMNGFDSESHSNGPQTVSPGDFQEALSLRTLPIPAYSSADILAEEAANQEKRARQKASRAGSKVEKNW